MKNKEFKHLNRSELVEVIDELLNEDTSQSENLPTREQVQKERERIRNKSRISKAVVSIVSVLTVVAAIAVLISTLLLPVIQVSGDSMEPTLSDGDIIVLLKTKSYSSGNLCCISWQNKLLLKRVVGMPGDSINIDEEGNVYINDVLLDEPYASHKCLGECDISFPYKVPEGKFFVLGDRRDISIDSRSSSIGCIESDQIVGRVLLKILPADK